MQELDAVPPGASYMRAKLQTVRADEDVLLGSTDIGSTPARRRPRVEFLSRRRWI
jgi:hypothetical protein